MMLMVEQNNVTVISHLLRYLVCLAELLSAVFADVSCGPVLTSPVLILI